jgi:hypothetical protein
MANLFIFIPKSAPYEDDDVNPVEIYEDGQIHRFESTDADELAAANRIIADGAGFDVSELVSALIQISWNNITGKPSTFTPSAHVHSADDVTSGTFDDARIAETNVTQHEAALTLAQSQVTGLVTALSNKLETSLKGLANGLAELDASTLVPLVQIPDLPASKVTSGTFADARIAEANVTQHEAALTVTLSQVSDSGDMAGKNTVATADIDANAVTEDKLSTSVAEKLNRSAKNNFAATSDPTVNDDSGDGYSEGSRWLNTTTDESYVCVDAGLGAAIWLNTSLTAEELGSMAFQEASNVNITGGVATLSSATIGGVTISGGNVDGRDVSVDGTKLDGIESGATADQTGAEIKAAYEAEADTNAYTDSEKAKLAAIEAEATKNATDAQLRDRSTHTGTQAISTVTGLQTALDAKIETADLAYMSYIKRSSTDDTTDLTTGVTLGWDTAIKEDSGFTVGGANNEEITFVETGAYDISVMQPYVDTSTEGVGQHNSLDMHGELGGVGATSTYRGTPVIDADGHREGSVVMEETIDATAGQVLTVHVTRGSGADPLYGVAGEARLIIRRVGGKSAAIAGMTDSEVKTAYENNADTNAYTDSEKAKLASIDAAHYGPPVQDTTALTAIAEADLTDKERRYVEDELSDYFYNATAVSGDLAPDDQTGGTGFWFKVAVDGETAASIKTKYESNADTNAFTDAEQTKLAGIEAGADVTDATNVSAAGAVMASTKGQANGVASLDGSAKIPIAQIPDGIGGGLTGKTVTGSGTLVAGESIIVDASGGTADRALPGTLTVGDRFIVKARGGSVRITAGTHDIRYEGDPIGGDLLIANGETAHLQADTTTAVEIM